jgi:hypothetical protein
MSTHDDTHTPTESDLREVHARLDALARATRREPDAGFEERLARASAGVLTSAAADRRGLRLAGEPAAPARRRIHAGISVGLRVAAALALASLVGAALLGRGGSPTAHASTITLSDEDLSLVFDDLGMASLMSDADALAESVRGWSDSTLDEEAL